MFIITRASPITNIIMEYNDTEAPLMLREFGRNIQMMVNYCKTLTDRDERNALAHEIVRIMSNINPGVRDNPDYKQKLWDHFYFLADYEIDIDSEYAIPERTELMSRPEESMEYANHRSRFRQYGHNVDLMIKEALKVEDADERDALVNLIANIMRMQLQTADRDSNTEVTVLEHLRVISKGELDYNMEDIRFYKSAVPQGVSNASPRVNPRSNKKQNRKKKYRK